MTGLAYWAVAGLSAYSQYAQGQQQKREYQAQATERQFEPAQADQLANEAMGLRRDRRGKKDAGPGS